MGLSTYEKWKDTEVEWPKSIPEHWELKQFRYLFTFGRGLGITKSNLQDEGIPCINYGEIHSKFGFEVDPARHELKCVDQVYLETGERSLLKYGDFVFADTSEDIEGSGNFSYLNSETPIFAGYHTVVAKPETNNDARFLAYLIDAQIFRSQIRKNVSGVKVYSITQDILKNCYAWLPTEDEQKKIVRFLDHKTCQIDLLIEKKKALIEKLDEQRIAVITQAVTKGIDKNTQMKPSDVEWLGDIPEHWDIRKLRHIFTFGRGLGITKSNLKDEGIPCINYGEIHSKYGFEVVPEIHELKCVDQIYLETGGNSLLKHGDFVFADTSEDIEGSGNFSYLNSESPTFAGYHTVVAKPEVTISSRFLAYLFDSQLFRYQIRKNVSGVKVFSITHGILKNCIVWLPPIDEQEKIVNYLDALLKKSEQMKRLNIKTIERLNEYRSALITSAVTGKIDVQNIKNFQGD